MADLRREQAELSAEEEDPCAVALEGTKAAGVGFDALNLAVESLGEGVSDLVACAGQGGCRDDA